MVHYKVNLHGIEDDLSRKSRNDNTCNYGKPGKKFRIGGGPEVKRLARILGCRVECCSWSTEQLSVNAGYRHVYKSIHPKILACEKWSVFWELGGSSPT